MERQVIYRKTAKGQEEMATRAYHLPSRERSLLVLIDGKRPTDELVEKSRHLGDSSAFLDHLLATGFIEPVGGSTAQANAVAIDPSSGTSSTLAPKVAIPTAPAALSVSARQEVIRFARLFLFDTLGPDADMLAARIEASRNQHELALALGKGVDALRAIAGRRKAEEFWQGVVARMPQIESLNPR